jgi:hypothetical protein
MSRGAEAFSYVPSPQESQRPNLRLVTSDYEEEPLRERKGKIVQYDLSFDTKAYASLKSLKKINLGEYEDKKARQDGLTRFNLETAIGERFNAGLSKRRVDVIDGKLCDTHTKEPLLAIIKRGVDWRANNGSILHDQIRERAELEGFEKIQDILGNRFTPIGTMMISISASGEHPSSVYTHNFVDVSITRIDEKGERYIEMNRLSSGLSMSEYKQRVKEIRPDYFESEEEEHAFNAVAFLKNPFEVTGFTDLEQVQRHLYKNHTYTDYDRYQEILRLCKPFNDALLEQFAKDPHNSEAINLRFNALLNKADEIVEQLEGGVIVRDVFVRATEAEIERLGNQEVREVSTGCGPSGGKSLGEEPIYSVAAFGESDERGSLYFKCPNEKFCGKINKRRPNERRMHCEFCNANVAC